jgi:transcriptional regulator with XRE-family HTH domain
MTKSTNNAKYGTRTYWRAYGRRLHKARSALNISEAEAAAAYEVTLRTYKRWEDGAPQTISSAPMLRFAKRYGVSLAWLMLGQGKFFGTGPGYASPT